MKGKGKTTKKRTCWVFTKNRSHGEKELDRYWTRETFSLRVRGFEESDSSSSSLTESTSRRRWSGSFLENQRKSTEPILTVYSLIWQSMESMFGGKRSKKEIPVLYWWFKNKCLFPSSSMTLRTQSYWSFITGQFTYSEQLLPIHLSCRMCNPSSFYHQLWIFPGGQNSSKRQTVFFLPVDPMDKSHKDPDEIDLSVPLHAQYLHKGWKRHQDAVYWVDINLAIEKGLTFYQTGRLDNMQDGRNTSRSKEINVNSFLRRTQFFTQNGATCWDKKSKHVHLKTARVSMLNRLMEERCDLLLLLIRLKRKTALEYVLLMTALRSTLTMKYFVKEWKNPLLIMTRIMNLWWWTRPTWTSQFQDYHIPLWNTRKVPAFDNWFRKLRTILIDMLFNKIYDRINHFILSVQNQNKWFGMLGTSNHVSYLRRNPKRSAKHVYHTGTSASTSARTGICCTKKQRS